MERVEALPCCGSTKFYEGPRGGACINVECAKCCHRWNIAIIDGSLYIVNDLGIEGKEEG